MLHSSPCSFKYIEILNTSFKFLLKVMFHKHLFSAVIIPFFFILISPRSISKICPQTAYCRCIPN